MTKMEELRWVRVFTPSHIPKYLVEQIKQREFSVEDFYRYHEDMCLRSTKEGPTLNPLSHIYVLVTPENHVKGFVWFTIEPLTKDVIIQSYSVDKDYWKEGGAVEKLCNHVKEIRRKANLKKIYWITNRPKHSIRHGFKSSRSVLMEYSEENGQDTNGRGEARKECEPTDATAAAISKQHSGVEHVVCE